jgi:hypothetical protein
MLLIDMGELVLLTMRYRGGKAELLEGSEYFFELLTDYSLPLDSLRRK